MAVKFTRPGENKQASLIIEKFEYLKTGIFSFFFGDENLKESLETIRKR